MKRLINKRIITTPTEKHRTRNEINKKMNKKVFHNRPFSPQEAQIRRLISSRMVSPKSMSQNENPEETDLFEKIKVYYKDHKIRKIKRNSIERENRPTSKVFNANKNKFINLEENKKKQIVKLTKTRDFNITNLRTRNKCTHNFHESHVMCKSPVPASKEDIKKDIKEFLKGYYPKIGLVEQVFGKRSAIRSRKGSMIKSKQSMSPTCTNIKLHLISPNPRFKIVDKSEYLKDRQQNYI